jgi:hypothetical protein
MNFIIELDNIITKNFIFLLEKTKTNKIISLCTKKITNYKLIIAYTNLYNKYKNNIIFFIEKNPNLNVFISNIKNIIKIHKKFIFLTIRIYFYVTFLFHTIVFIFYIITFYNETEKIIKVCNFLLKMYKI